MVSSRTTRRSNRNAIVALPLTRPDSFASVTVPLIWAPDGMAVTPDTVTGLASAPFTGSSTLLLFEASVLNTVTLSDVPAGTVISRNVGAGGGAGAAGAAAAGADVPVALASGVAAGVDSGVCPAGATAGAACPAGADCGGLDCEHATARHV